MRCAYADVADHAHAGSDADTVLQLHGGNNVQQDGTDLTVAASMSEEIFNSADMTHDCVVAGAVFRNESLFKLLQITAAAITVLYSLNMTRQHDKELLVLRQTALQVAVHITEKTVDFQI